MADEEYDVERLVEHRPADDHFLVKWTGHSSSENSWEPRENLSRQVLAVWAETSGSTSPASNHRKPRAANMSLSPEGTQRFGDVPSSLYGTMDASAVESHRRDLRLREFDIEVEHRLEQMRVEIRKAETQLKRKFTLALIKIPKNIKNMPLALFRSEYGGDMGKVQEKEAEINMADAMAMPPPPPPSTVRRSCRKRKPLENQTNTAAKGTGSKKQRSSASDAGTKPTPSTISRRSSRRNTQTPAEAPSTASTASRRSSRRSSRRNTGIEADMENDSFATPMVGNKMAARVPQATPALDPRLPKTPFLRLAKRGESIMSINGSPIAQKDQPRVMLGDRDSSIISLNLNGGKILQLDGVQSVQKFKRTMSKRAKKEATDQLQRLQEQIAMMQAQLA